MSSPCGNWIDAEPFWLVYGTRGSKNSWWRQTIAPRATCPSRRTIGARELVGARAADDVGVVDADVDHARRLVVCAVVEVEPAEGAEQAGDDTGERVGDRRLQPPAVERPRPPARSRPRSLDAARDAKRRAGW